MNTWILVTLIATGNTMEPTQAQQYASYEQCMVEKSARYAERIPKWHYECVPLLDNKVLRLKPKT